MCITQGDSFIDLNPDAENKRVAVYRWNGFGFSGVNDSMACESCLKYLIINGVWM